MSNSALRNAYYLREYAALCSKIRPECKISLRSFSDKSLSIELLYIYNEAYCNITIYERNGIKKVTELVSIAIWCLDNNQFPDGYFSSHSLDRLKSAIESLKNQPITKK